MKILLAASLAATLVVSELPVPDMTRIGVTAAALGLVWWMVMVTIPNMLSVNKSNLDGLTAVFKQMVKELNDRDQANHERLCLHFAKVEAAISTASKEEAALLKQVVQEAIAPKRRRNS